MTVNHVVVDGSNLATEGRTLPSLQQLDEAVRAFIDEYKPKTVTVVVDASFPNRIDESERAMFEEAVQAGELISPPAGVIGRGDAFVLQIADRADAVVLSNDSFQEFHGQYGWLFDEGRLIGGKPVPHVGWVFMDRSPVRGPLSRRSMSDAKKAAKATAKRAKPSTRPEPRGPKAARGPKAKAAQATEEAPAPKGRSRRRGGRSSEQPKEPTTEAATEATAAEGSARKGRGSRASGPEPYNEPLVFIEFVAAHPVGSIVEGEVERFSSHGAYVVADGARCYLPLKHLGDPPPRSAREVLSTGERYEFVVHAFDTPRRGVDLAIPGVVPIPAAEPVELEAASDPVPDQPEEERVAPAKKATGKKAPAKKKAAAKKAPARKTAAKKKSTARKTTAKKAPAKRSTAKRSTKKAPAKKKSTAKRSTAKKATKKKAAAKKSTARKSTAKKSTAKRSTAKKAAKKR